MPAASDYVWRDHVPVFQAAAKHFKVFIAVRKTNAASLGFIPKSGYVGKRFDCKAKTANNDVLIGGRLRKTAGLVVDWNVMEPVRGIAYGGEKLTSAEKAWKEFEPLLARDLYDADGSWKYTYFPGGKVYGTQMDPNHDHYGCVMFSPSSLIAAAKYIHGDYDLYAIVPEDSRAQTIFVVDDHWGNIPMKHARAKKLYDIQIYLNSCFNKPLVLHGDQEKYADHPDREDIVVFFPDGRTVKFYSDKAKIEQLYRELFQGRLTGGKGANTASAGGLWQKVVR